MTVSVAPSASTTSPTAGGSPSRCSSFQPAGPRMKSRCSGAAVATLWCRGADPEQPECDPRGHLGDLRRRVGRNGSAAPDRIGELAKRPQALPPGGRA